MDEHALTRVITLARKHPRMLFNVNFIQKMGVKLGLDCQVRGDRLACSHQGKEEEVVIITAENCARYKCAVKEGTKAIRIFEFIQALVTLLTGRLIPPSPYPRAGATAQYYVEEGTKILEEELSQG